MHYFKNVITGYVHKFVEYMDLSFDFSLIEQLN